MKGLMKLDMQDNYLGPVDFTDFAGANITQLYLDYNVDMGAVYGLDKLNSVRFLFVVFVGTIFVVVDEAFLRSMCDCGLTRLPDGISTNKDLYLLDISQNPLGDMSVNTFASCLDTLYMSKTGISRIPGFVYQMEHIRNLDIGKNKLTGYFDFSVFKKLNYIEIAGNNFDKLPSNINNLISLRFLSIGGNTHARDLLSSLNIPSLVSLSFSGGVGGDIPASVFRNHKNLTFVSLSKCSLKQVPPDIFSLYMLQDLYIDNNDISSLPDKWDNFPQLHELDISDNPIKYYPDTFASLVHLNDFDGSETASCSSIEHLGSPFTSVCTNYEDQTRTAVLITIVVILIVGILGTLFLLAFRMGKKRQRRKTNKELAERGGMIEDNVDVDTSSQNIGMPVSTSLSRKWSVSKKMLTFDMQGKLMDVNSQFSEEFELFNTSNVAMSFIIMFPSRKNKYTVEVYPSFCDIEAHDRMTIKVNITLHCTTKIDEKMYIVVTRIPMCHVKEIKEYQTIRVVAQGKASSRIDYDEIHFEETIGHGSFGAVSKGTWRGNCVAVKELKNISDISLLDFIKEVDILEQVRSPFILQFYGAVITSERMCLVTEYMPHGNLMCVINDYNLSPRMRVRFMLDFVRGLYYLHCCRIMHRDVKSENVLVVDMNPDASATCKIADFGSSRTVDANQTEMNMTRGVGTPVYMAPEVVIGKEKYDFSADVYSTGVMLSEIWNQEPPFQGMAFRNVWALTNYIVDGNRPVIKQDCPPELVKVINKCWDGDPAQRMEVSNAVTELENLFFVMTDAEEPNTVHAQPRDPNAVGRQSARSRHLAKMHSKNRTNKSNTSNTGSVDTPSDSTFGSNKSYEMGVFSSNTGSADEFTTSDNLRAHLLGSK